MNRYNTKLYKVITKIIGGLLVFRICLEIGHCLLFKFGGLKWMLNS